MRKEPVVSSPAQLKQLEYLSRLMDAQFRIPGSNFGFGLDALIGLIPGAGDLSTFAVSGFMVSIMARNGASGFVLARMVLNIVIDSILGSIPIIGDIFDVAFKANMRNMRLMREHYVEGRHRGGAWKIFVPVLLLLLVFIGLLIWGVYSLILAVWQR